MDEVTKAALEIAVEQLEEAERIIEALTEENARLKMEAAAGQGIWATGGAYPRQQVTWNSPGNATVTHVALHTMSTSANNASTAVVNLAAKTEDFKVALDKLKTRYEAMIIDPGTEQKSYKVDGV